MIKKLIIPFRGKGYSVFDLGDFCIKVSIKAYSVEILIFDNDDDDDEELTLNA